MLGRAWLGLHLLLAATLLVAAVPWWLAGCGIAGLVAHASWRRPPSFSGTIVCRADGRFDLPDAGQTGLTLAPHTSIAPRWAQLVLADRARKFHILISRDQIDAASWRRLAARLGAGG